MTISCQPQIGFYQVTVDLAAGQEHDDVDVGFVPSGSIGDLIFQDTNGDGDPTGDSGLPGVTVSLMRDGKVIQTTVTDKDGLYKFDKLPAGKYVVKLTHLPPGLENTVGLDNPKDGTVTVEASMGLKSREGLTICSMALMHERFGVTTGPTMRAACLPSFRFQVGHLGCVNEALPHVGPT